MNGWLRLFALNAQARAGFSSQVLVWAVIAAVASMVALVFLLIAAFVWLADRYDPLTAGLVLGGAFVVVAVVALVLCLLIRRRNMARARVELAAGGGNANWLDPKVLDPKLIAIGFQVGQAIGWRRLVTLAAIGFIAAGVAKEWLGRAEAKTEGDAPKGNES
jgi:hypothetical protein